MPQQHFRSIWISDLHLGTRSLQNEKLLDFLQQTESEFLYLVGDIFDLLQAQKRWHWPTINDRIVQTILAKAENGAKVIYIPGNHDHMLRKFDGCTFSNIRIQNSAIHETADGKRCLVTATNSIPLSGWRGWPQSAPPTTSSWCATAGSTSADARSSGNTARCLPG